MSGAGAIGRPNLVQGTGHNIGGIEPASEAMKLPQKNSVAAQSFRQSWQSLLKVPQGVEAEDATNSEAAYEDSVSLEECGSSNQTRFRERSTQLLISGIPLQSASARSAPRLSRLPQSLRGNRMDSAPESHVAASASSGLPKQMPLKAIGGGNTSHFQKSSPDKHQPSVRVQLAAISDTRLPVPDAGFGLGASAPSPETAPPTSEPPGDVHTERSDSKEESVPRTLEMAVPTSDSDHITSASKSTPKADTLVPGEPKTLASGPVASSAVLNTVFEGRNGGPIEGAAGTAAAPFITINHGAKGLESSPADRSIDLEALGSDGLNLSASVHERTGLRGVQTSSLDRAAADKSKTSGVHSTPVISGGNAALHEDQTQRFPAASISLQSGLQFATGFEISAASTARRGDAVREPFLTLDGGPTQPPLTWTLAGTHRAEAGFQDPSLGWVTVRAQEAAGGIHATLVPATADAAQVLGSHLAGLNTYMATESAHLNPITLSAPDGGWNSNGQSTGGGDGQSSGNGGGEQEGSQSALTGAALRSSSGFSTGTATHEEIPIMAMTPNTDSKHISVLV